MNAKLKVKRITDTAKIPTYAHDGDACFDIYSDGVLDIGASWQVHATGLKFDIPYGYAMMIYSRWRGLCSKRGISEESDAHIASLVLMKHIDRKRVATVSRRAYNLVLVRHKTPFGFCELYH